ncbi:MAG: amidohydrolase [Clostridiales Family XIII bacterium]|jgi:predicted amidohydrolase YtcJ|nr:amidohydrolase [Clostridiales Family XIII bacterium]
MGNKYATSVWLNGKILTVDDEFSIAEALVVKNDYLIYVGDNETARKFISPETEVFDLEGKTVLPGLMESHTHFSWLSNSLTEIDGLFKSKENILDQLREKVAKAEKGEWIQGRGWNQDNWDEKVFPTKFDLDEVAPDNPVVMIRADYHSYWVNSAALKIGGIDKDTKAVDGGEIIRFDDGEPTGVLIDKAGEAVTKHVPPYQGEKFQEALRLGQKHLASYGFSGVMDAGASSDEIAAFKQFADNGELDIRLYVYAKEGDTAREYYKKGAEIGLYGNKMTIRGVKFFTDGAIGSRGAAMVEDYADDPGNKGLFMYTDEQFYNEVREARLNGFQISAHAIGDAAVEQVVNTFKKVLDELPDENNRWRIEHFQTITKQTLSDTVKYKFIPSMQFTHCTSDVGPARKRYGEGERLERSYRWRDVLDAGLHIAEGSDAPVEYVNPYHGFYAGVARKNRAGEPADGGYPGQCLTREEVIRAATIWSAEAQFEEHIRGSLEIGKFADFAVIDKDLLTCNVEDIKDIQALRTVVGGKTIFEREAE